MLTHYLCAVTASTLANLELMALDSWSAVDMLRPVQRPSLASARTGRVRVRGGAEFVITSEPVELTKKLEVFRLGVRAPDFSADKRFRPPSYEESNEMWSAFLGRHHHLYLLRRRVAVDAPAGIGSVEVDDVAMFRDPSGQRLYIAADTGQPGAIVVCRQPEDLPNPGSEVVRIRAL